MSIVKHIISQDGTKIGYRQTGSGDGLIIVHGTGRISRNYEKLAHSLSDRYTVYIYDRRGRGLSEGWTQDHSMAKEIADLVALTNATQAKYIFGHSFGGVISLRAAMQCRIQRLAVYEPPVSINNSIPSGWLPEFEKALFKGKKVAAMATFLKALPPPNINKFPAWALMVLGYLVKFMERNKDDETKMLNLLYTIPADMKIVRQLDSETDVFRQINVKTLLMYGTDSQSFFQQSVKMLEEILPDSSTKIFTGFDHYSPEEKANDIASALKEFFV